MPGMGRLIKTSWTEITSGRPFGLSLRACADCGGRLKAYTDKKAAGGG